jgi:RNA polymerase sigma-70 factor (ECF subfamily)
MVYRDPTGTPHSPARNGQLQSWGDEDLMRELRAGNDDAFAVVFDRYHRLVRVTALRIVGDAGEAEDLTQAIFLEIYCKAAQFDPGKGILKKWILQYAYHRSINRKNYLMLRQFYQRGAEQAHKLEQVWESQISPPAQETAFQAGELLSLLNGRQREVMEMVFFEGLSLRDVAERTGQTLVNVRHHYYRGLERLRAHVSSSQSESAEDAAVPFGKVSSANA